jgi:sugar/nucleoside kinase (ribokinase family)
MCTYLGATKNITVNDIDTNLISSSKVTYLEGYLWDAQNAKDAISFAIDIAKKNGRKAAMSLSDSFCVARHREEFLELIKENIDILFANEDEIKCLFQSDDLTDSISKISKIVDIAAITLGEKGSIIVNGVDIYTIDAQNNIKVIDTTGAGDLYAGGFLFGYTNGYSIRQSAALGTLAASHVIQHIGARPKIKLVDLIREVA